MKRYIGTCAATAVMLTAPTVAVNSYVATLPSVAEAHTVPWSVAKAAAINRASVECFRIFPLDPFSQRCRTWGYRLFKKAYHCKAFYGEPHAAWCFPDAWASNQSAKIWTFKIKVGYVAEQAPGCPPQGCQQFRTTVSNRRPID